MRVDVTEDAILLDGREVATVDWLPTTSHTERANVQQRVATAIDLLVHEEELENEFEGW